MRLRRINRPKAAIITAQQLLLTVVEKREAVKRECTEAKRRVDSAKPNPQGAQASAREHQPSEFLLRQRGTVPVGVGDAASSRVKYAKLVAYQSLD